MEIPKSLAGNLGYLVATLARQYRLMFDREMQSLGLTRSQWWLLTNLYYHEGVTQARLSELLEIDKAAVTRQLVRLEKHHWVTRNPSNKDGRAMVIALTPKAQHVMQEITDLSDMLIEQSFGNIGKRKIREIYRLLNEISDNLDDSNFRLPPKAIRLRKKIREDLEKLEK